MSNRLHFFFGNCIGVWSYFYVFFLKVYPLGYVDICVMHFAAVIFGTLVSLPVLIGYYGVLDIVWQTSGSYKLHWDVTIVSM